MTFSNVYSYIRILLETIGITDKNIKEKCMNVHCNLYLSFMLSSNVLNIFHDTNIFIYYRKEWGINLALVSENTNKEESI